MKPNRIKINLPVSSRGEFGIKKNIKPSPVGSGMMKSRCQLVRVRLSQHPTRPGTLPSLLWSDFQLEISIWKDWACRLTFQLEISNIDPRMAENVTD